MNPLELTLTYVLFSRTRPHVCTALPGCGCISLSPAAHLAPLPTLHTSQWEETDMCIRFLYYIGSCHILSPLVPVANQRTGVGWTGRLQTTQRGALFPHTHRSMMPPIRQRGRRICYVTYAALHACLPPHRLRGRPLPTTQFLLQKQQKRPYCGAIYTP